MLELAYGFGRPVNLSFDEAVEKVTAALEKEGFGVVSELDMRETFKEKLGEDFMRYTIFGVCNPGFAHRAITAELGIGVVLPCNVVVYQNNGDDWATVLISDPRALIRLTHSPRMEDISNEVRTRLRKVVESL